MYMCTSSPAGTRQLKEPSIHQPNIKNRNLPSTNKQPSNAESERSVITTAFRHSCRIDFNTLATIQSCRTKLYIAGIALIKQKLNGTKNHQWCVHCTTGIQCSKLDNWIKRLKRRRWIQYRGRYDRFVRRGYWAIGGSPLRGGYYHISCCVNLQFVLTNDQMCRDC